MKRLLLIVAAAALCAALYAQSELPNPDYSAYILTPKAPDTPRINGPKIYGQRPGSDFIYKIPATGIRPMTFDAIGLPKGLKVDKETGIITGKVKKRRAGEYKVTLVAENSLGRDEKAFRIVIGDKLALTPPMGWNSWNAWRETVNQEKVMSSLDGLLEHGLDQYGWSFINIDDGWQARRGGKYNAIQPNHKFGDMKALGDYIHSKGLKFGIYSSPWVRTPGAYAGSSCNREDGIYDWQEDGRHNDEWMFVQAPDDKRGWAEIRYHGKYLFVENDAKQWADWGVDYLKYDWHPNDWFNIRAMGEALRKCGRDIVYSTSNRAPLAISGAFTQYANCWRTSSDIKDLWPNIYRIGFTCMDIWAGFTGPGNWPDADMLEIGRVRTTDVEGTRPCRLSPDEQFTHITLWTMLASPMLIGCDLGNVDDFTLSLLTNNEVIDVNQDPLGIQGIKFIEEEDRVVMVKPLEDGTMAVALFNVSTEPIKMTVSPKMFQMVEAQTLRDLWRQKDIITLQPDEEWETEVAPHGTVMLKMSPGGNANQEMWWLK